MPHDIEGKWTNILFPNHKQLREVPPTPIPLALLRPAAPVDSDSERTHGPCNSPTSWYYKWIDQVIWAEQSSDYVSTLRDPNDSC